MSNSGDRVLMLDKGSALSIFMKRRRAVNHYIRLRLGPSQRQPFHCLVAKGDALGVVVRKLTKKKKITARAHVAVIRRTIHVA
jgi:hypothetical protein